MTKITKRIAEKVTGKKKAMALDDLFEMKLQALYDIENELVDALPDMAENATDDKLVAAFKEHLEETRTHISRLEEIFSMLDMKAKTLKCEGIRGIIDDAKWLSKNVTGTTAMDAGLISAAQYAEYYEMAGYASAVEWARILGHAEAEALLKQTLSEEEAASDTLLDLALSKINREALGEAENTEE